MSNPPLSSGLPLSGVRILDLTVVWAGPYSTMLLAGAESIRDVIAFPKTQTAACPLTDAPTTVSEAQLRELSIRVRTPAPTG